jgi:PAS domain S-box-containing protein
MHDNTEKIIRRCDEADGSEHWFRDLLNSTREALEMLQGGRVEILNKAASELFGIALEDAVGKRFADLVPLRKGIRPASKEKLTPDYIQSLLDQAETEIPQSFETEVEIGGNVRIIETKLFPVVVDGKKRLTDSSRDITAER